VTHDIEESLAEPSAGPLTTTTTAARRTLALAVALVVACVGAMWAGHLTGGGPSDPLLMWWSIAPLALIAQTMAFEVEFRRETYAFTFSEIPMLLGLFLAGPLNLLVGRLLGEVVFLAIRERRLNRKIALNLASFLTETTMLLAVHHALGAPTDVTRPTTWLVALVSVTAADLVGYTIVYIVVRWHGAATTFGSFALFGGITIPSNTSFALVIGILMVEQPWATLLLAGIAAFLLVSYRSYTALRQRYDSLSLLYDFTRLVSGAQRPDAVLESILSEAKDLLRAERAEIWLCDESGPSLRLAVDDAGRSSTELDATLIELLDQWFVDRPGAGIIVRDGADPDGAALVTALNAHDCIVAPITESGQVVGLVAVVDRIGEVRRFVETDRTMFATLANHASVALENGRLIDRLHHEAKVREHEALHDALTGLPNRVLLASRLRSELQDLAMNGGAVAVGVMDLDGFKDINDTLGHGTGDLVLIEVARRLSYAASDSVLVARLGGDEFALIVAGAERRDHVEAIARRVLDEVSRPLDVEGIRINIGASIGFALAPDDASDAPTLLQRADVAMYSAKAGAGKGVAFYDALRDENSPRRLTLANDLRGAVSEGQLFVVYQPKAALADRRIDGYEALVRWHHPQFGQVFPDEFIPLAERTSMIGELTVFVLGEALAEAARWNRDGHDWSVAVNVAMRNLLDDDFVHVVSRALAQSGCPPRKLTLEITETSVMSDTARTIEVLRRLAALGVRLSVDDFGTGYSSLSYLQQLPVEEIKIDQLFVREMSNDSSAEAIVRSVLDLARNLGLRVVAEGVEDGVLWERLRDLRCEIAQGYHLSRPMLPGDVEEWARMWDEDEPEPMPLLLTGRGAPRRA
jgi:diguanylate cyclase (GGDEF)-like protein